MTSRRDSRLFAALVVWALLPSVYQLVRMRIVAVNGVDLNILGQMEWFDLIDEVLMTTLMIPLYSLLHSADSGGKTEENTAALFISFAVYAGFTALAVFRISGITAYMNAVGAERYLAAQASSMLAGFVASFGVLLLTVNGDERTVLWLTLIRFAALTVCDLILISRQGDIGAAHAEMIANAVSALSAAALCFGRGYLGRCRFPGHLFLGAWIRRGAFAGLQIFLDNFIYAVMVCKLVNAVSESGNYWVANNFIWGWLLVPVSCFSELIRKNDLERLTMRNTWRFAISIAAAWAVSVPFWRWFIQSAMAMEPVDAILRIAYPSAVFYLTYIPSAFLDSWFISKGKTWCLTVISAVVNLLYYGVLFVLFRKGICEPSMRFIIQMFGWGMVVHLALSAALYFLIRRTVRSDRKPAAEV